MKKYLFVLGGSMMIGTVFVFAIGAIHRTELNVALYTKPSPEPEIEQPHNVPDYSQIYSYKEYFDNMAEVYKKKNDSIEAARKAIAMD